jgi:hypothetical protein
VEVNTATGRAIAYVLLLLTAEKYLLILLQVCQGEVGLRLQTAILKN